MSYMYSMKEKGFYPAGEKDQKPYVDAGTLPDDLKPISDKDYQDFFGPPDGYYGVFDETGPHIEKILPPDPAVINMQKARTEYDRASVELTAIQQRMDDEDYDSTHTEASVAADKVAWTTYRKALRAYIAAADGAKALPTAPNEAEDYDSGSTDLA